MKNLLPAVNKPKRQKLQQQQPSEQSEQSEEDSILGSKQKPPKQQDLHFDTKLLRKDSLFVSFSGQIQNAHIQDCQSLTLFYQFVAGPDWKQVSGRSSTISQIASNDGEKITFNMPFQIAYQTTYLYGWPQLIVILYGTDFFGRSFIQGYGNIHLPTTGGQIHSRKMRIFKLLPQSTISGIFGYLGGVIAELKEPIKVLTQGQGRQVTRTATHGSIDIKVQTTKHNFKKFGYE